ncbi:MAG: flagellar hook-basal body complex protein FliE [Armatimonadetes bacterium]|nr:flagellar hook-basal body complex protein FliE [Armatimonadota bacterium]
MKIDSFGSIQNPALQKLANDASQATATPKGGGSDFAKQLMDVLKEVNATEQNSVKAQQSLMTGQPVDYHDLMIAMEKASTAMQLTMSVRNKVLEAYQEISHLAI